MKKSAIPSISAVIVTYGNRASLVEEVVNSLNDDLITNIVVVNNGSDNSNVKMLKQLEIQYKKLHLLTNKQNLGSSGGLATGLKYSIETLNTEYVWILDDDNKPQKDAIHKLVENLISNDKTTNVLLSYRADKPQYLQAVQTGQGNGVIGAINGFMGFHLFHKIKAVIKPKLFKAETTSNVNTNLACAPYGGIFISTELVKTIGYPNIKYFVYMDDFEWTYRLKGIGAKIEMVPTSVIDVLDLSWNSATENSNIFTMLKDASDFRFFYSVRNRLYFERENLIENYWVYTFNKFSFLTLYLLLARPNWERLILLRKAMREAQSGQFNNSLMP